MLTQEVIRVVKSTVPVLAKHGLSITSAFYKRLFHKHPELKNVFNMSNQREGKQPMALANAVYAAAQHIDNLGAILPHIQHIGHKHRALNVVPEHYPIVGENLLAAIKEVLGEAASDEILSAWGKAYGVIAQAFIDMEATMYKDMLAQGGWEGYKSFRVVRKAYESERIASFYLKPEDGKPLPLHQAGQYITVLGEDLSIEYTQPRQYSLSMLPNSEYYRISVKREDGSLVSAHLHEQIEEGQLLKLSAPAGNFVLDTRSKPLVLLAGGIGITPLLSMLHKALADAKRDVYLIHAVDNSVSQPFVQELSDLKEGSSRLHTQTIYRFPTEQDRVHKCFDAEGILQAEHLAEFPRDAQIYCCGPVPFMQHAKDLATAQGFADEQFYYEFFGPAVGM